MPSLLSDLRCIVSWPENESDGLPEVGKLLLALSDVLGLGAKSVDHDLVLLGQAVLRHQVGSDGGDQRLGEEQCHISRSNA